MAFFDKHPQLFRIFFLLLGAVLLAFAAFSIYRYASSLTDENIFRTSPSNLYVSKDIPGKRLDFSENKPDTAERFVSGDSVKIHDLVLAVNNKLFDTGEEIQQYLNKFEEDREIELAVFRPHAAREFTYLVRSRDIPDSAFRAIRSSVFVLDVTPNGASDRAGLKVGDLIIRINGQPFKDAQEADRILRFAKIGLSIAYEVLRAGQILTLEVTLAKVGIRTSILVLILCGLLYMGTAIFVALRRPRFQAARLIGFTFLFIGFFMAAFMRRDLEPDTFSLARDFLLIFCILFTIPLMLHLGHYFPIERPELLSRKWIRFGAYFMTLLFTGLSWFGEERFFFIGVVVLLLYAAAVNLIFYRKCSKEYKTLNRAIRYASALVGAVVAFFLILVFLSDPNARLGWALNAGYIGIPLALIPMAYLYTIGHYRLLDLDIRVRRNIQYNIITFAWGIAMLVVLFKALFVLPALRFDLPNIQFKQAFIEILDTPMEAAERAMMEKGVVILLGIGITVGLWKIRRAGQNLIDRLFDRGEYDYRRAAGELAEVMSAQFTMAGLAEGIVQKLAGLMFVKQVGIIFFRDEKALCCSRMHGAPPDRWETFCASINRKVIDLIQKNRADFRFTAEYLPDETRGHFLQQGFRHIIAIRSKEKLVGVLLIGEKRSETPFHKEDLAFLSAVARQASVAIENAFLYEELAEQQRLKHELDIARRIQLGSLPQRTPTVEGLDIAGISIPAQEVGGDYFDYLNGTADELTVIVGDVSGKGTSAALYMSKVQGIMRSLHDFGLSPRDLFIRANQILFNDLEKTSFFTAVGASFQSRQRNLILARAGHSPVFHYQAETGQVRVIIPKGIGLGLAESHKFAAELSEEVICYQPGDVFLFITDGITEAHSTRGEEFGEENILKILQNQNGASAKRIRDSIIASVNHFTENARQHDDLTVVVVKAV